MDIFGFYQKNAESVVNVSEFIACNFIEIASRLAPGNRPEVLYSDLGLINANYRYAIMYHPEELTYQFLETGQEMTCRNVIVIDEEQIAEMLSAFFDNPSQMFVSLWQTIFHELRHFVQYNLFNEQTEMYVPESVITDICALKPEIAEPMLNHIKVYKKNVTQNEMLEAEIDAVIMSILSVIYFTSYYELYGQQIKEDELFALLTFTRADFEDDPSLLFSPLYAN